MTYISTPAGQFVNVIPQDNEDPNIPLDLLNLAKAIEKRVLGVYATPAARDTAVAGLVEEGMWAFTKDTNALWYYDGAAWVAFPQAGATVRSGSTAPSNSTGVDGDVYFRY